MLQTAMICSLLLLLVPFSTGLILEDIRLPKVWTANLILSASWSWNTLSIVEAGKSPEEAKEIKRKIARAKELIEKLNDHLEDIKEDLKEGKDVTPDILEKVVEIKDEFKTLQVDADDIPTELLQAFYSKVTEAFKLILKSFGPGKETKAVPTKEETTKTTPAEDDSAKTATAKEEVTKTAPAKGEATKTAPPKEQSIDAKEEDKEVKREL